MSISKLDDSFAERNFTHHERVPDKLHDDENDVPCDKYRVGDIFEVCQTFCSTVAVEEGGEDIGDVEDEADRCEYNQ